VCTKYQTKLKKKLTTVTPVAETDHEIQEAPCDETTRLQFEVEHLGPENVNDTLTQNSITALLSSKFRVRYHVT
jgi:hypothetical protein